MAWQETLYTILLSVLAATLIISALYVWWRRHAPGVRTGALILLAGAVWALGYALELASVDLGAKVFWHKAQYVGIAVIPTAWLVYMLQYTAREKWLTRRHLALLSVVPLITLLLVFTNEAHRLVWSGVVLETKGSFLVLDITLSVGFWVLTVYAYTLILLGFFLLVQMLIRSRRLYRWQASALLLAVLTPFLVHLVVDTLELNPFSTLDLTPFVFGLILPVIAWSLQHLRLLDVVPVAREAVIEGMSDGVMVLDAHNRIVDLNPVIQRLIGRPAAKAIGRPVEQVWPEWSALLERFGGGVEAGEAGGEVVLAQGDEPRTYDMRTSSLVDWRGRLISRVIVLRDITERKRAEEASWDAEAKYRALVEQLPAIIYIVELGKVNRTIYISPQIESLLGFSQAGWLADPDLWIKQLHPDDRESVLSEVRGKDTSGEPLDLEYRVLTRDGRVLWFRNQTTLVRDETGRIRYSHGVMFDITERKQAEEALKRRLAQLASLNRASQAVTASLEFDQVLAEIVSLAREVAASDYAGVVLVDEEGGFSRSAKHLPGVPDIEGRVRAEGFTSWIVRSRQAVVVDNIDQDGTINPRPADGAPGTVNPPVTKAGVRSLVGLPLVAKDRLLGVLFLYSLRPGNFRARLPLLTTFANQAAVAIENARLHQEVQHRVEELIFLNRIGRAMTSSLDLEQVLTTVMQETTAVLKVEAASVMLLDDQGDELVFETVVGPQAEKIENLRLPLGQGIAGWVAREGQPLLVPDVREDPRFYPGIDQATGFVTKSVLGIPLEVKGKVIGVIETVNKTEGDFSQADVALLSSMAQSAAIAIENAQLYKDLQNRMEELKRTQAQLVQSVKLAAIGELAASVAHELNNPLTSIVGFTNLLLREVDDDDPRRKDLQIIEREAARTRAIVRGLLDFAHQTEARLELADVNEVVRITMTLLRNQVKMAKVTVEESYGENLPPVALDVNQIKQVFLNIITNALQAMPQGGELEVGTDCRRQAIDGVDCVAVRFRDTGTGISAENLPRIFDPFFTTKKPGQGTGLGLSISHGIVEKHGGKIEIESEVGRGSTFTVLLPVA